MASEQFIDVIEQAEAEADQILASAETKAIEIQNKAIHKAEVIVDNARTLGDKERQKNLSDAESSYRSMLQELEQERHTPLSSLSPATKEKTVNALAGRIVSLFGNS
ncbi:MAG TPA: hypothetical protein GXZ59_07035 [Clostridiaceae bacterium]|nr:hypothetical protein [Clostridiaceae bacterium]